MKMKTLVVAIATVALPATSVFAAALDRSGQSISAFLQPGNYAEIGVSSLYPTVEGKDRSGNGIADIGESYTFGSAAIKLQPTEKLSFGMIYDEPFGARATYRGSNNFTANGSTGTFGNTSSDLKTRNLTTLFGYEPIDHFKVYGGVAYQEIEKAEVDLRGTAYSVYNGYSSTGDKDSAFGWVAGMAYEIPEIALKASLTYRSEIEHNASTQESLQIGNLLTAVTNGLGQVDAGLSQINAGLAQLAALPDTDTRKAALLAQQQSLTATRTGLVTQQARLAALNALAPSSLEQASKVTTPQSVNLDFQTGVMADTVAFANLRWVEWSGFAIRPALFGAVATAASPSTGGFNLVDYTDDQWSANVGVGRKLSNTLAGNMSVGWDSGAGNPVTTLGPTEGYWNVGLGLRYSPAPQVELSGGVKYFWLGDATAKVSSGTEVADFEDNHALAVGLKLGYRF